MKNTICITGTGIISAYGAGTRAFTEAYGRGECGVRALTAFSSPEYQRDVAAEVRDFDPVAMFGNRAVRAHDRVTLLLMGAADLLYKDLGLPAIDDRRAHFDDEQVGMVVGTFASLRSVTEFDMQTVKEPEYVTPTLFPNAVFCAAASHAAIRKSIRGSCITLTNGEPSALQSFALGVERLLQGGAKQVVVGGAEELTEIYALAVQIAHTTKKRTAPVLGEGAALFSLETRETARARGARELAEVLASGSSFCPDAHRAYERNLERIRESVGDETLRGVRHLFGSQKAWLEEVTPIGGEHVEVHALYPRFGYAGSLTGGLAVAAMLADARIPSGELVLVNNVSEEGNASTVLFRKLANAWEGAS